MVLVERCSVEHKPVPAAVNRNAEGPDRAPQRTRGGQPWSSYPVPTVSLPKCPREMVTMRGGESGAGLCGASERALLGL